MCAQLHCNICEGIWVKLDNAHRYGYVPQSVTSHECTVTILWNKQVRTDRTVANKPDIIIHENKGGICVLADVVIPGDRNCD